MVTEPITKLVIEFVTVCVTKLVIESVSESMMILLITKSTTDVFFFNFKFFFLKNINLINVIL